MTVFFIQVKPNNDQAFALKTHNNSLHQVAGLLNKDNGTNPVAKFESNQNCDNAKIMKEQSLLNKDNGTNPVAKFESNQKLASQDSPGSEITQTTSQVRNACSETCQISPDAKNGNVPYSSTSRAIYDNFEGPSYTLGGGQISPVKSYS